MLGQPPSHIFCPLLTATSPSASASPGTQQNQPQPQLTARPCILCLLCVQLQGQVGQGQPDVWVNLTLDSHLKLPPFLESVPTSALRRAAPEKQPGALQAKHHAKQVSRSWWRIIFLGFETEAPCLA